MANDKNKYCTKLEEYCQQFYAHNKAAQHLVANKILQENHNKEQHRHASFEQGLTGHLSVSTTYYTVSDSSKWCWEEDTVDNSTINEFDYSDIQPITDDYLSEISEEPIKQKQAAEVLSLSDDLFKSDCLFS